MTDGSTSGDSGAAGTDAPGEGLRTKLVKALFGFDPREILQRLHAGEATAVELRRSLDELRLAAERLQHEVELVRDERVPALERRADSMEEALRADQSEIARLRDERVALLEGRADALEASLKEAGREIELLRDERVPTLENRADHLETSLKETGHEIELLRDERFPTLENRVDHLETSLKETGHEVELLRDERIPTLENRVDHLETFLKEAGHEVELLRDERIPTLENRADGFEEVVRLAARELESVRDHRLPELESRLDETETHLAEAVRELDRVRDERLPAAVARQDVLHERLAREQEELGSLVERILLRESLPVPGASPREEQVAEALEAVQPLLLEEFRGGEEEIRHRLERYLPILEDHAPVLDLGCGRGELLLLLREAGIEAAGVEGDPALATAARRRGLVVRQADAVAALREEADDAVGAVTAIHLLEHLDPVALLELLAEVRRVLRPGGVLAVECPNPHSLRVGAALFWLDPTHIRPLLPETLALFLRASGFSIETTEYLHPFPDSHSLVTQPQDPGDAEGIGGRLARLERRLDTLLNGFRDFSIVARKPSPGE